MRSVLYARASARSIQAVSWVVLKYTCIMDSSWGHCSSLQGLSCLRNLQHLSLAHNHLARVNEIENCMLLQTLNLQGNNLQQVGGYQFYSLCDTVFVLLYGFIIMIYDCTAPRILFEPLSYSFPFSKYLWFHLLQPPHLVNSILLRELKLDDNSISSLEPLSSAWLPLLQTLSVSQNRWDTNNYLLILVQDVCWYMCLYKRHVGLNG